jgi:hypothetical protein
VSAVPEEPQIAEHRSRLESPAIATALGVLVLVLLGLTATLAALIHQATFLAIATGIPIPLVYASVGVIVARHQPRNPVGWILIGFVVLFLVPVDAGYYATFRYHFGHHVPFGQAALVVASLWPLAFALFPLVILLFPDGRLISRRWRRVLCGYAVAVGYVAAVNLIPALAGKVGHDIYVNSSGNVTYAFHLAPVLGALNAVAYAAIGLMWLSFVGRQALSWRRATGDRRQQLKWLACGAAITLCLGLLGSALSSAVSVSRLLEVGVTAMPIAIGVGILRYRLYDIDRIISRTLAYAIVTGLLVGVYAAWSCWPPRSCGSTARWRSRPPRSPRRRCSARCAGGSSGRWTAGSTGPATTPSRPSRRSRPGSRTRWTWTRSAMTWPGWCRTP